ncbi:MAG: hypothetical protein P4L53_02445 [Candidatus Obscuribacterales bacterium]|nr:hypothetical protein [Candidatus Obscuribacterales bacterium]
MNTLLSRVANWFEYLGKKTANTDIIDWDEINHMRQRLVQMRFAKPATALDFAFAAGPSLADQSSLKGTFVSTNIRSKDRATIRRWNGSKSVFSDSQSDSFDSSAVTVTKYGAPKFAVAASNVSTATVQPAQSVEVRLTAQRSLLRTKLIATNQSMAAYDLDGFAVDSARDAELKAAMEQLESSTEH